MKSVDPVERRGHSRVPLNMEVEVCLLSDNESKADLSIISCRARDVSEGGVSFVGEACYQNESLLRLRISLCSTAGLVNKTEAETKALLKVMGKVMWCKKNGNGANYVTGVQFLNIYEQDFQILNDYVQKQLVD